jgi:tetratricopeptide (TPR) repeat protein
MLTLTAILLVAATAASSPEQTALLERLQSGGVEERRIAAERLGEIGDDAATPALVRALHDPDVTVRNEAHDSLWAIWHRSGDPAIDARLAEGTTLMQSGSLPEAIAVFTDVIARAPDFAEGWNKRATAYYLMGDLDRSLADCEEVVKRNPAHFGALSGFGLIYLQKDDLPRAAEYFEKALAVDPTLIQVEAALLQIREVLRQRRQQTI